MQTHIDLKIQKYIAAVV